MDGGDTRVVDLINKAKVEAKEQKIHLLAQVKEICFNRDRSLLPEVIPMVAEFQTDFNANCRKFVASFLREVVRSHPEHVGLVVPVASFLMHDSNTSVKKVAILLANTTYRPALQRLVDNGSVKGAQQDWSVLEGLRKAVLNTINSGPADISMVAIKFAESVVLACVGGRGLGPTASRGGDKSVQRDLSPSHPFLLADTLDQAGHALARQMVGWLGNGGGAAAAAAAAAGGGGASFGAQHYSLLINALQNLATNRAALFADIVPALAAALESVNGGGAAAAADGVGPAPKGLHDAASSLRSACLRLLKVAPGASRSVQRLATAAALSGSDGEAKAAVDGNSTLRGRIKLPARPRERPKAARAALTARNRRDVAELATSSASKGKMPHPPPPGYKQNRTKGFPLGDLDTLLGHVLNALGPELATAKNRPPPEDSGGSSGAEAVGSKRARGSTSGDEGGGKRRSGDGSARAVSAPEPVRSTMEVDTVDKGGGAKQPQKVLGGAGGKREEARAAPRAAAPPAATPPAATAPAATAPAAAAPAAAAAPSDPGREGLETSKKAFRRVLGVWEGVAMEGKRGLHQGVVARLGRMLAESEATALAKGAKTSESEMVVAEVVEFMTKDYRKRFKAALALLTDMYVADVAAAAAAAAAAQAAKQEKGKAISRRAAAKKPPRGFDLYDGALLRLLTALSGSLEATWRQKLFTQTLLECPRVPPAALELVCTLCDIAAHPHDVQTGLVALKDLIFHKPATRGVCIPSVLRFTHHSDNDVRTKAVRLTSNLLWKDPAFQTTIETFAKQALASVRPPEVNKVEKKVKEEVKPPEPVPEKTEEANEEDLLDFEGEEEEEEEEEEKEEPKDKAPATPPAPAPVSAPPPDATPGGVPPAGPWLAPPDTAAAARVRLSLYFALCVKSRPMLSGLLEAYVTAIPAAKDGLKAELPLLARAAAKGFGEAGVVGLVAASPVGAKPLALLMLDLLVPRDTNKPSPEMVAAVRRLRETRLLAEAEAEAVVKEEEEEVGKVDEPSAATGVEYIVPILGGLGREGVMAELPALLQASDGVIRAAFRRLTQPAKGATYKPAELVVVLNQSDARVPIKNLTRALSLCLENKAVYNYPVLREALNVMSQVPTAGQNGGGVKQIPLLLMRTVMVSVATFPELKNFVATVVLVRLVQQQVWTSDGLWKGFLRCAKMMAKESGATSFIAMVQLPEKKLKEALANPLMKGLKEPLRRYAQTLVKVDPGVRAVLGMETGAREAATKK
ncbi:conserved unknown protein [Ectocarpus siliculosus]|uniref:Symplekin n=1 Tax=Ectocarpus siliculosus TaxID=2880 RepID=D7FRB7_ECTSI|nr:conserved unknown protein [Ectocarpus siliculosus]|eukprot:CBJ30708.1 conserved unknown protein [Ectocarpus siliculosus]